MTEFDKYIKDAKTINIELNRHQVKHIIDALSLRQYYLIMGKGKSQRCNRPKDVEKADKAILDIDGIIAQMS